MPTAVHETMQFCFSSAISTAETDLPFPARCFCVTNEEMNEFEGQYSGSVKIADLSVQITNADGELETKLVVEIGFSEKYEDLINDIKLWLEGMNSVSMCVLVYFEEEPSYRCPIDKNMKEKEFKRLKFLEPWELKAKDIYLESPFGPATYKELNEKGLDEETDNKEIDDKEIDDKEINDKEMDDKEIDDEEVDNEEMDDEEMDYEGMDDEELDDEELNDEELNDKELDSEKLDNKKLVWVGRISTVFLEQ